MLDIPNFTKKEKDMKKSLLLFAIFVLVSVLFCSCKPSEGDSGADNADKPQNNVTDTGFFAEGKQFYFVEGEGVTLQDKINGIYSHVTYSTYVYPKFITSAEIGGENEIVFGKCDRDISTKAYRLLEQYYDGTDNESAWVIYVKDNSACVAFDSNQAMRRAIDYFEKNLLEEDFGTKKGVVAYEHFDKLEAASEEREAKREAAFEKIEYKIGAEAVNVLKNLYSLCDEGLYMWLANLWCPDVGGFYYSNSGRNTEGFLPDIETTKQVLGFITSSGMVDDYEGGNYQTALLQYYPEIAGKILNFAVGLQAEDGYFYHPQWKDTPSASRLNRDLNSARGIITKLGGTANYPYPEDSFDSSDDDELVSVSALTGRLGSSSTLVVSKVIATASAAPAYLQSLDKWAAYIDSLGIDKGNSYSGGNTLVSQKKMIKAAGQKYCDYLINYLNSKQYDNGTWEPEISYGAIDGLMKISGLYEHFDAPLPRTKEAAQSCITRIIDTTPKASSEIHICDVYNTWYALAAVIRMSDKTIRGEIRQSVMDNLREMIDSTCPKLSIFRKHDGSFSWYEDESHYTSQGSVVAVPRTNEGDVNATTKVPATIQWVFECIGVHMVPIYTSTDFEIFMDTICDLGSIIKDEAPDPIVITFDDFDISIDQTENGIVLSPDDMVDISVRDKDMENGEYTWLDSEVVASPDPRAKDDNAVRFEVITKSCTCSNNPCTCKKVANKASLLYAKAQNSTILGNAYIAEFDFYLDEWGSDDIITQMGFSESEGGGSSMFFNLKTYMASDGKNYLNLSEYYAGLDGVTNDCLVEGIPTEEWVRFRFELYKTEQLFTYENSGEVKQYQANVCKIFVNGEYVGESDSAPLKDDGTISNKHVNAFSIQGYRHVSSVFYVDNVLVYRTNTEFDSQEEQGNGVLDNIALDKTQTVATFEDGKTVTYYLKNTILPDYIKYTVEEIAGKKALHVEKIAVHPTSQVDTQASLSNPTDEGECYTYETKIYYDSANMASGKYVSQLSVKAASTLSFISLNFKYNGDKIEVLHNKNYLNGSDLKSTGAVEGIDGKALKLPVDEWFTFKLEFYRAETPSESMVKIYVGDANGENMALCAEFNGYMTEKIRDIERFSFTHYRATANISVYLDDISFTRSDKEFVSELPDENVDGFDNGYTSGGLRISDNTADDSYSGSDSVSAGSDPKNNANNVVKITSSSASAIPYSITVNHSGSQITNGLSVFETKIFVESAGNGAFATIAFVGTNGAVQEFILNKGADGKVFIGVPQGYTVTSNGITASNSKNKLTLAAWNTLRIEFANADDAADAYVEVFINGTSIGKFIGYKSIDNVHTVTLTGAGSDSVIYLDDVYFREFLLEKAPIDGVGADELTTTTKGETFEGLGDGLIGDGTDSNVKFGKNDGYNLTFTQPDDTIVVTGDPTGSENKVLMFRDGAKKDHSTVWVVPGGIEYNSNSEKYVISTFETKFFVEKPMGDSGNYLAQLIFTSGKTSRIVINLQGAKTDGEFTHAYFGLMGENTKFELGKWHTLRIEYHNVSEGSTLKPFVEIFINGVSIGQKEAVNSQGSADYNDVDGFFWKSYSGGLATIYFDNMSYTEKQTDYPQTPETPETPEVPDEPIIPSDPDTPKEFPLVETFDNLTELKGDGSDSIVEFGTKRFTSGGGSVVSGDEIKIVKDPTGADNNVLMFKDGSTSSFSSIWISAKDKNGKVTNGISIFETKIYVPKSEILTSGALAQPEYGAADNGSQLFYINLTKPSDSGRNDVYFKFKDATTNTTVQATFTPDAWHTVRLEFYNYSEGSGTPIVKIYVDDYCWGDMAVTKFIDAGGFRWSGYAGAKCTIYFDDMSYIEKGMPTE